MIHSPWSCPLSGLLKLNFDGSFNRESGRGGFGGFILEIVLARLLKSFQVLLIAPMLMALRCMPC